MFCLSDKLVGLIFVHSRQIAIVLAIISFLFDNLREKEVRGPEAGVSYCMF